MKKIASTLFALLASTAALAAQTAPNNGEQHIAGIVAIVGDSAITSLELRERLLAFLAQNRRTEPPPGPEYDQLSRQVLDDRINELLLLQAAARDTSLRVLDAEVALNVDNYVEQLKGQYGEAGLVGALQQQGRTLAAFRDMLIAQQRSDMLLDRFVAKLRQQRKPPPITEEEIRKVWEDATGRGLQMRPATISFEQVVVPVLPSDSSLATAKALADSLHARVLAKEDFAALARRYSEDAGSKELGGDLGWFRRGQMQREFEDVAFFLRPGDVSPPVLSPYGFHIIKLERVRGAERMARHILIRPVRTADDEERARVKAEEIAGRVRAGEVVQELARQHGDRDEEVRVGPIPRDSLPPTYKNALAGASLNQVVGPLKLEGPAGINKWTVVNITALEDERPATLDDYREQIRQNVARQKLIEEFLDEERRRTFIEIRVGGRGGG